jgi:hypothetical protein
MSLIWQNIQHTKAIRWSQKNKNKNNKKLDKNGSLN